MIMFLAKFVVADRLLFSDCGTDGTARIDYDSLSGEKIAVKAIHLRGLGQFQDVVSDIFRSNWLVGDANLLVERFVDVAIFQGKV